MEKILVQDYDASILEVLKEVLELEHFSVHTILDPNNDFLAAIDEFRPHVVLLDYGLNTKSCREICQSIKEVYPHLPVIAMSCNMNIHEDYKLSGFDDYIAKPFDLDHLYWILRKHLSKLEALSATSKTDS